MLLMFPDDFRFESLDFSDSCLAALPLLLFVCDVVLAIFIDVLLDADVSLEPAGSAAAIYILHQKELTITINIHTITMNYMVHLGSLVLTSWQFVIDLVGLFSKCSFDLLLMLQQQLIVSQPWHHVHYLGNLVLVVIYPPSTMMALWLVSVLIYLYIWGLVLIIAHQSISRLTHCYHLIKLLSWL